jgi:hypothetical protein
MKSMSQIETIKEMARKGKRKSEICRELHIDYKTARKYIEKTDFNISFPEVRERSKKLDAYEKYLDALLEANRNNWHKQQLTAKRVYTIFCKDHAEW